MDESALERITHKNTRLEIPHLSDNCDSSFNGSSHNISEQTEKSILKLPSALKRREPIKPGNENQFLSVPQENYDRCSSRKSSKGSTSISFALTADSPKAQSYDDQSSECSENEASVKAPKPRIPPRRKGILKCKREKLNKRPSRKVKKAPTIPSGSKEKLEADSESKQFDSTGLFHWCATRKLSDALLV